MEQATILVVDDDREIVGAIAKLLELDGHRVLRAYDGLEALEILHEQTVHLIILDVMRTAPLPTPSAPGWIRPRCTSMPPPASPTAASSALAARWAFPPRSWAPAAPWACVS